MTLLASITKDHFRYLLDAAPDAMIIVDQTGRILLVNSQTEKLFGFDRVDLQCKLFEVLIPERFRAQLPAFRSGDFAGPRVRPIGVEDLYGLRRDRSEFPVEISLSPLWTDEGLLVTCAIRDITERKRSERAWQEKNAELLRANQAQDRFLANMSHELRTPLNGIIGFAEFLADGKPGAVNAKQKEYLEDVLDNGRHLLHLINNMLDLVKIQSGTLKLNPETFQLQTTIAEVCAEVWPLAQKRRIELQVHVATELGAVTLDALRFKQILYNLLSNALKFSDVGGLVEVRAQGHRADRFRLSVRDCGIGIKQEDILRLFGEFEQLETGLSRRFEGTGLGLAVTRKIVELNDGVINVVSEVGKGSEFSVVLPLVASEEAS
jgi:protein-histidine pros-kinase